VQRAPAALPLALVLALACGPLYAQRSPERAEAEKKEARKAPKKVVDGPPAHEQRSHEPRKHEQRKHEQRSPEPRKSVPARNPVPERSERPRPPTTPPSQAELLQRKQDEDRRLQLRQQQERSSAQRPVQTTESPRRATDEKRGSNVRCSAHPVCKGGGYGSCRGVEQSYGAASLSSSRTDIVRQCMRANNPDTCNCSAQCGAVAQCSIF
jgi:hypothetical protein